MPNRMPPPHLLTMSAPNAVRVEIHIPQDDIVAGVEGPPEEAAGNAWCILDSTCRAYEKAGKSIPLSIRTARAALASGGFDKV